MRLEALKILAAGAVLGGSQAHARAAKRTCSQGHQTCTTLERDVAILGGGASGTYAAIRLLDSGKSVVVIEADDQLGGHTETYTDPTTGQHDDIGVIIYHNMSIVQDYFARFDIPLALRVVPPSDIVYYDFQAGEPVLDVPDPTAAMAAYYGQLLRFPELLEGFDKLPDPVPEDLLLPFGEFAEKYGLEDALPLLSLYGQGGIDFAEATTMYILKYMGPAWLQGLSTGSVTSARGNNHELYQAAYDALGAENVLLNSLVTAGTRSDDGVQLTVKNADGSCVEIKAGKLVVSVAPTLDKLSPLDLDETETSLFQRFTNTSYFTSVVRNTGLPKNTSYIASSVGTKFHLPHLPGPLSITPAPIDGLVDVKYGSGPNEISIDEVKAAIANDFGTLLASTNSTAAETEFAIIKVHTPFQPVVPPKHIASGFYKELWALQGRKQTYFTGAAWQCQDSALLWNFTEIRVLPLILGE